uniref:serine/threonine-protein phosphatase 7 long form homolog n=1 Tax=Erigeron canadensis TaxID=72917 RepID=UPI001CB9A60F|nr:serine/threonine-protein phosphatase 7 long form homolog [Erigeron canadensis]
MPHISPKIRRGDDYDFTYCYACRWNQTIMTFKNVPSHVVVTFRAALTALKNHEFEWTPYNGILHQLPQDCRDGSDIWAYTGWLIHWSTVEPHVAHRVTRQFGLVQDIPVNELFLSPTQHREIHDTSRTG